MSRSIGAQVVDRLSPILMSPEEISSSPAIILSVVVLPQPDGPTKHHELAVADVEVHVLHGMDGPS